MTNDFRKLDLEMAMLDDCRSRMRLILEEVANHAQRVMEEADAARISLPDWPRVRAGAPR